MIEIKLTGEQDEIRADMETYLAQQRDANPGRICEDLDVPENVTKQVIYEPVQSESDAGESYIVTVVNDTLPIACTCADFHYRIRRKRELGIRHPVHSCKHMIKAAVRFKRF